MVSVFVVHEGSGQREHVTDCLTVEAARRYVRGAEGSAHPGKREELTPGTELQIVELERVNDAWQETVRETVAGTRA